MRLGLLAPVSSFRPGLHTAAVYKETTLYGRFSVQAGLVRLPRRKARARIGPPAGPIFAMRQGLAHDEL